MSDYTQELLKQDVIKYLEVNGRTGAKQLEDEFFGEGMSLDQGRLMRDVMRELTLSGDITRLSADDGKRLYNTSSNE